MQLLIARHLKGKTQYELSFETGIPQTKISLFENGYARPNERELAKLAKALDIEADKLEFDKHELRKSWKDGAK